MTIEEFKLKLDEYSKKSKFPNIDENENNINIAIVGLGQIGIYLYIMN